MWRIRSQFRFHLAEPAKSPLESGFSRLSNSQWSPIRFTQLCATRRGSPLARCRTDLADSDCTNGKAEGESWIDCQKWKRFVGWLLDIRVNFTCWQYCRNGCHQMQFHSLIQFVIGDRLILYDWDSRMSCDSQQCQKPSTRIDHWREFTNKPKISRPEMTR
jgi:hypothetical protein